MSPLMILLDEEKLSNETTEPAAAPEHASNRLARKGESGESSISKDRSFRQFAKLQVAPTNFVWPLTGPDAMNLQADESFGMRLEAFFVYRVRDLMVVDPRLNLVAPGHNTVSVPLAIFEEVMGLAVGVRCHPAACGFSVNIARHLVQRDFDLGSIDTTFWFVTLRL